MRQAFLGSVAICSLIVDMNRCIFCGSTTNSFSREEHLLPESLGGSVVVPAGLVCDACNQYFGKEVEREALASPILQFHRALLSMPTKKGKQPRYASSDLEIRGSKSGRATLHPTPELLRQLLEQNGGQISVEMFEFGALIRLLLKIGLELAAMQEYDVHAPNFDAARMVARSPKLNSTWPLAFGAWPVEHVQEARQDADEQRVRQYFCDCLIVKNAAAGSLLVYLSYGSSVFIVPLTVDTNRFVEIVQESNHSTEPYYQLNVLQVSIVSNINSALLRVQG